MASRFSVHLHSFSGIGLAPKDTNGKSDPYLKGDFDKFRTFKTERISKELNPTWKFEIKFLYDTKFPDKLAKKEFHVEVWDHDRIGKDNFIGECKVDLQTLAAGPCDHEIMLVDGSRTSGRVKFVCEMEHLSEVKLSLKNIVLKGVQAGDYTVNTYYTGGKKDKVVVKSTTQRGTDSPHWDDLFYTSVDTSLRLLAMELVVVEVMKDGAAEKFGSTELKLSKYLVTTDDARATLDEPIRAPATGAVVGRLTGFFSITDVPKFAQMKEGKNTEDGVIDGVKLFDFLPNPTHVVRMVDIPPTVVKQAPPPVPTSDKPALPTHPSTAAPRPVDPTAAASAYPDLQLPSAATSTPVVAVTAAAGGAAAAGVSLADKLRFAAMKVSEAQKAGGAPLPVLQPGWSERTDPITGRVFYVNTVSGETTWDRPAAPTLEDTMADNEHMTRSQALREPELSLPAGWVEQYDANTGKHFFANTATGEVTWTRPAADAKSGSPTPDPVVVNRRASIPPVPAVGLVLPLPAPWMEQKDPNTGKIFFANAVTGATTWERPVDPLALPSGWVEQKDPTTGKVFYANTITHATSWERPTVVGTTTPVSTSSLATVPNTLPIGWIEQRDQTTGRVFYVNTVTKVTSWERPSSSRPSTPVTQQQVGAMPPPPPPAGPLPAGWIEQRDTTTGKMFYANTVTKATTWERPTVPAMPVAMPVAALPPPWIEQKDPQGRTFYANTATGATTWDRPTASGSRPVSPGGPSTIPTAAGLPAGWVQCFEPGTNRPYYTHTPTGKVQWDTPVALPLAPLPIGWIEQKDPQGRTFYANTATGATTWDRPSNRLSNPPMMMPGAIIRY